MSSAIINISSPISLCAAIPFFQMPPLLISTHKYVDIINNRTGPLFINARPFFAGWSTLFKTKTNLHARKILYTTYILYLLKFSIKNVKLTPYRVPYLCKCDGWCVPPTIFLPCKRSIWSKYLSIMKILDFGLYIYKALFTYHRPDSFRFCFNK